MTAKQNRSALVNRRLKAYVTTFADPDSVDDAKEAYGDWPEIDTPCDKSPVGQCEFHISDPDTCIHCGKRT